MCTNTCVCRVNFPNIRPHAVDEYMIIQAHTAVYVVGVDHIFVSCGPLIKILVETFVCICVLSPFIKNRLDIICLCSESYRMVILGMNGQRV